MNHIAPGLMIDRQVERRMAKWNLRGDINVSLMERNVKA